MTTQRLTYADVDRQTLLDRLRRIARSPLRPYLEAVVACGMDIELLRVALQGYELERFDYFMQTLDNADHDWCTVCRRVVAERAELVCWEGTRQESKTDCSYSTVTWDTAFTEIHHMCSACRRTRPNTHPGQFRDRLFWCGQGYDAWIPRQPKDCRPTAKLLVYLSHSDITHLETSWHLLPMLSVFCDVTGLIPVLHVSVPEQLFGNYVLTTDDFAEVLREVPTED
jgi:hypothetical protein